MWAPYRALVPSGCQPTISRTTVLYSVTKPLSWLSRPQHISHLSLDSLLGAPPPAQTTNHIWSLLSNRPLDFLPEDYERPHFSRDEGCSLFSTWSLLWRTLRSPVCPASTHFGSSVNQGILFLHSHILFICDLVMFPVPVQGSVVLPWHSVAAHHPFCKGAMELSYHTPAQSPAWHRPTPGICRIIN